MKRRRVLAAAGACGVCLLNGMLRAQSDWQMPKRFVRPDITSDEGGLWALMDREEKRLRQSPFVIRDPALRDYIQAIACKLAADHCPDVRVHLVSTPLFNASMAPNGMMQIWTGLMLRMENEAQLAAIIGHEIGHYIERHSIERLRDARSRGAFTQFLGLFGVVGALGQLAILAGMFAYSREQENDADRLGVWLMAKAGYDPREAARVWANLLLEIQARRETSPELSLPLFATHPAAQERKAALETLAQANPGGSTHEGLWQKAITPFRHEWLQAEVKRNRPDESLALLNRLIARFPDQGDFVFARGEVYNQRATGNDEDAALADYEAAARLGGEPPQTHRAIGMIYRSRKLAEQARASFERYLQAAPNAPDALYIKALLAESGS
jgi:predicted Zn-dependent protease